MAYPPSVYKTWIAGETLTAADLNNSFLVIPNSNIPDQIQHYSANLATMQITADPYPSGTASLAATLAEELTRLRYQVLKLLQSDKSAATNWYERPLLAKGTKGADVASAAALTLGIDGNFFNITGTTSVTSIGTLNVGCVVYLKFGGILTLTHHATNLILPGAANITTAAGDVATLLEYGTGTWILVAYTKAAGAIANNLAAGGFKFTGLGAGSVNGDSLRYEQLATMWGYRKPALKWVSVTQVDAESGLDGTLNDVVIVFPDGTVRTDSTSSHTRFDITRNAVLSGTKQSGLRTTLSEANNTWYALYAVKATDNSTDLVIVGDTLHPTQANFATLNSNFGTNGWVFLGRIRNGDESAAIADILDFAQHGNKTTFRNSAAGNAQTSIGIRFATSASTGTLAYTYASGTGAGQIPPGVLIVDWMLSNGGGGVLWSIEDQVSTAIVYHKNSGTPGLSGNYIPGVEATRGIQGRTTSAASKDIFLTGFIDAALGVGPNPLL